MDEAVRLPKTQGGNFFGVAQDGRMLFVQRPPQANTSSTEQPAGIYAYIPITEEFELVVGEAVFPLYIGELGN